jgi:DNA replication and repair protein RecF
VLREGAAAALVQVWNEPLVRAGARVSYERARWVDERSTAFATYYSEISGGQQASLTYRPSVEVPPSESVQPPEVWADGFRAALAAARDREARMGTTVVGPHRDELRITLDGERDLEVRDFGSGGQRRTAALGLRLIEAATIRDARGLEPLVLMDDVFAELDADRSERILDLIEREEAGQVILTAPKESDVRLRRDVLPRWGIRNGRIEA